MQATEDKGIEQVHERRGRPGNEITSGDCSVGSGGGGEQQAENEQLAGHLGGNQMRRRGEDQLRKGRAGELRREVESPRPGPISAEDVTRAQPWTGDEQCEERSPAKRNEPT